MSEPVPSESRKARRSIKNFVLQPLWQVKFGLYSLLMSIGFSVLICLVVYINMAKFVEIVLELTGVQEELKDLLNQYLAPLRNQLIMLLLAYIVIIISISIKFTHKLIGPTVAFRRHIAMIAEGNWDYRTKLRDGDAFLEVAQDLNELSETLAKKYGST